MSAAPLPSDLPQELLPLSWLLGTWVGVGTGQYPGIEDFRFGQEISFATDGRPFMAYISRSWLLNDDGERVKPLATETGFWRPRPDNKIELTLAHPTGYAEVWEGEVTITGLENARITGAKAVLRTTSVGASSSAKPYSEGERLYGLVGEKLLWTFDMMAMGKPMGNHLAASLQKVMELSTGAADD